MQIQLKQAEIEQAIKQYIGKQGIAVAGKDVAISFTAGRKAAGLMADIIIEDSAEIPGLEEADAVVVKPTLTVVPDCGTTQPTLDPQPAAAPEAVEEIAAPKAPTVSLFS